MSEFTDELVVLTVTVRADPERAALLGARRGDVLRVHRDSVAAWRALVSDCSDKRVYV